MIQFNIPSTLLSTYISTSPAESNQEEFAQEYPPEGMIQTDSWKAEAQRSTSSPRALHDEEAKRKVVLYKMVRRSTMITVMATV